MAASKSPKAKAKEVLRQEAFKDLIPKEQRHNPAVYPVAVEKVRVAWHQGLLPGIEAKRIIDDLKFACLENTTTEYDKASSLDQDPLLNLTPLFEQSDVQLSALEQALVNLDDDRLDLGVKKKWLLLLKRMGIARDKCRRDAAAFWLYVGTDDNPQRAGQQIVYAPCHVQMFAIWDDDEVPNSLIEAPVGHGKSTCLRGQMAFEIGKYPELRHLYVTEAKELAHQTVGSIRRIITSGRFQALFPDLHILDRNQKAEDSQKCFTVGRLNTLAKDPTMIGVGYRGSIQGSRFDRIWADDIVPQDVRHQPLVRKLNNDKWNDIIKTRLAHPRFSKIRMIGTPWHAEDVLGKTVKTIKKGMPGWQMEIDAFRIRIDKETDKPIPIWPEVWDAESLQKIRNTSSAWQFTHELRFGDVTSQVVSRVHWYNSSPVSGDPAKDQQTLDMINQAERWLSIDPAGTGKIWSSGQGVVEYIISPGGFVFLSNVWFFRCGIMELLDKLVEIIYDPNVPGYTRYTGTQWEAQGAVKVGFPGIKRSFIQMLEEKGISKHKLAFVEHGTKFGGAKQSQSKMARLENAAPYLERGAVRLAGKRVHGGQGHSFFGPIPGSAMAKLADLLITWDGDKRNSDAIDAVSQWILWNQGRIASPVIVRAPVYRQQKKHSPNHLRRHALMKERLNAIVQSNPLDPEEEFMASKLAGVA